MFCQLMSPLLPRHDSVVLSETQTVINDILFVCVYNLYNAPIIFRNTDSGLNLYMWCFQGIKKRSLLNCLIKIHMNAHARTPLNH